MVSVYILNPESFGTDEARVLLPMAIGEVFIVLSEPDEHGFFSARSSQGAIGLLLYRSTIP